MRSIAEAEVPTIAKAIEEWRGEAETEAKESKLPIPVFKISKSPESKLLIWE